MPKYRWSLVISTQTVNDMCFAESRNLFYLRLQRYLAVSSDNSFPPMHIDVSHTREKDGKVKEQACLLHQLVHH